MAAATLPAAPIGAADGIAREPLALVTATGRHSFEVEIARTPETRSKGLMFRRTLGARHGMLFLYDDPQHVSMWMRNTYIPLDMVFILPDGTVHRVERETEPFSEAVIEAGARVQGVLEIPGGTAEELRLAPGDTVEHPHFGATLP